MARAETSAAAVIAAREVGFGSAHLLVGGMPEPAARALLEAAIEAGATRLDTAPLYGHGRSEPLVAQVAAAHGRVRVTTKVGLEPVPAPPRWRSAIGAALRRLPPGVDAGVRSLLRRGAAPSQADAPSGRFGVDAVRRSIERSLARLGPIDRLLLHEVHPADIDETLLDLLAGYQRRGGVRTLGVATGNAVTADALGRSRGLFTVAHVSIDPLGARPPDARAWPAVRFVGHGALGAGGRTLACLKAGLGADASLGAAWAQATRGTFFEGGDGAALALLARAASLESIDEVLVATRRLDSMARTVAAAGGRHALPAAAVCVGDAALRRWSRTNGLETRNAQWAW